MILTNASIKVEKCCALNAFIPTRSAGFEKSLKFRQIDPTRPDRRRSLKVPFLVFFLDLSASRGILGRVRGSTRTPMAFHASQYSYYSTWRV